MLAGGGEDWLMRVDVNDSFVVSAGTPLAAIHIVLSDTGEALLDNEDVKRAYLG